MNINSEAQKNPDQLEREVDERRAHMSETLNALEEKLSPGHLMDQVIAYTRSNGGEFSQNLVNTIKRNPVPSLLTAVGLAWLMIDQNKSGSSSSTSTYTSPTTGLTAYGTAGTTGMKESAAHMKDSVSSSLSSAKLRAGETSEKLRQQAHHASESLRHQSERARAGFSDLLEHQPLALGAIGIAIGALIGGSLPPTRKEDALLGDARDRLAQKASTTGRDTLEKAKDMGQRAAHDIPASPERPAYHTTQ